MVKTAQLDLPLLMPAQAQKHVTVNEALIRLDAASLLRVVSASSQTPPETVVDGGCYIIPEGALAEWKDRSGQIAIWSNGGWIYLVPKAGWSAWDESVSASKLFDGHDWITGAIAVSPSGGSLCMKAVEFEHIIQPGRQNATSVRIGRNSQVVGVTGRVQAQIAGANVTGWRIGVSGSEDRYGSALGLEKDSYLIGVGSYPGAYYSDTPLLITAEGGTFSTGTITLVINLIEISPPRAA